MREIKFRAWITDEGQMYSAKQLSSIGSNGGRHVRYFQREADGSLGYMTEHSGLSANVMQYTGLHDKNGVEIYEGDIVAYAKHPDLCVGPNAAIIEWLPSVHGNYVKFVIDDFAWKLSACQVIGNIYENPELLTTNNRKGGNDCES